MIRFLGAPIGMTLPSPTHDLAGLMLQPDWVYQLEMADPATNDQNWSFEIEGGVMSTMLLESYPPQLGKGETKLEQVGPCVAFKVDPAWHRPVLITAHHGDDEKIVMLRPEVLDKAVEYAPGELLIGLAKGITARDPAVGALLKAHGLVQEGTLLGETVVHVRDTQSPPRDVFDLHAALIWDPLIRYAEPNYIAHTMGIE